jgi:hypothetical protein
MLTAVGSRLVGSVLAGTLATMAPYSATLGVLAVALVGAVAKGVCDVTRVGPLSGLMFTFAAAVCTVLPTTPDDVLLHLVLSAGAAAFAWIIAMAGVLIRPDGPQRLAVARALRAVPAQAGAAPPSRSNGPGRCCPRRVPEDAGGWRKPRWRRLSYGAETVLFRRLPDSAQATVDFPPQPAATLNALADRLRQRGAAPPGGRPVGERAEVDGRRAEAAYRRVVGWAPLLRSSGWGRSNPISPPMARVAVAGASRANLPS